MINLSSGNGVNIDSKWENAWFHRVVGWKGKGLRKAGDGSHQGNKLVTKGRLLGNSTGFFKEIILFGVIAGF